MDVIQRNPPMLSSECIVSIRVSKWSDMPLPWRAFLFRPCYDKCVPRMPLLWRILPALKYGVYRPRRWSIFQSDGMVNVFFQATIDFNGFSMVLIPLDHHHWMFLEGPTIGFDGFSMVFEILRAMVNDGLEVNNGVHVPSHKKCKKPIRDKMRISSFPLQLGRC